MFAGLWLHAAHVRRYLSVLPVQKYRPDLRITGSLLRRTVFPEFREADRWREVAVRILASECDAQICRDGVHFERSTCIRYVPMRICTSCCWLSATEIELPDRILERVQQMIDFLVAIRRPDGVLPALGDSDGGCLLPLRRSPCDARPVRRGRHTSAGVISHMGCRRPHSEVMWLLGGDGLRAFEDAAPDDADNESLLRIPLGGYACLSDWTPEAHRHRRHWPDWLPRELRSRARRSPQHSVFGFGEPCLIDAGTYSYTGEPQWRDYFENTAAHSTVMVDGMSRAEPAGPFGWHGHLRVRLREWHSTPEFDFLDAEHNGYLSLADPVAHRRRVIFVKPGY